MSKIVQLPDGTRINLSIINFIFLSGGSSSTIPTTLNFQWGFGAASYSYPYTPTSSLPSAPLVHAAIQAIQPLEDGFYVATQFLPVFAVTFLNPNTELHGSPGTITVNGIGFVSGLRAFLGPTEVTSTVTFVSSQQFTFTDPGAAAAGLASLLIVNPNGTTTVFLDGFTWT